MNKEFIRMQKLAGIITEGLYTSNEEAPVEAMSHGGKSKMTKETLKNRIREMMLSDDPYKDFPNDIDWEVVGRDMDGLSLRGYSETTDKYYDGAIGGSYDPDTDPNPKFSNSDLLFIEEVPFHHLNPQQKHSVGKDNTLGETPEDIATRRMGSMDEDASDISSSVSKSSVEVLVAAARRIIGALKDSGFEQEDIYDYIMDKVKTLSVDEALFEAKKDEEVDTEEVIVAKDEVPAEGAPAEDVTDTGADLDGDGTPDIDTGSPEAKKTLTALMDSFNAAKQLGDPKLIQMAANQLTYFNKNILFKAGQPQA